MIFCLDGNFGNKIFDFGYCPRINLTLFAKYIWKAELNISWLFLLFTLKSFLFTLKSFCREER